MSREIRHRRSVLRGLRAADLTVRLLALAFLFMPVVATVVMSFSDEKILKFPPGSWGTRQYDTFFGSSYWLDALWESIKIGVLSASIAVVVGLLTVLAIYRTRLPLKGLFQAIGLSPLLLPGVAYAVALYTVFVQVRIRGDMLGLVMTHAVLAVPLVLMIAGSAITRIPAELELVAMTLGASRSRAIGGITLRLMVPALATAFVFAFLVSFNDAVFVSFLGGPGLVTLPKAIFDSVKTGIEPVITAIATLLMLGTGLVLALLFLLRRRAWIS